MKKYSLLLIAVLFVFTGFAPATTSYVELRNTVKIKINIGPWNMDTDATKTVAHGLVYSKIISVEASVRNDVDGLRNKLNLVTSAGVVQGGVTSWDNTNFYLLRINSGSFDDATHSNVSGSYNRGWIIVEYEL